MGAQWKQKSRTENVAAKGRVFGKLGRFDVARNGSVLGESEVRAVVVVVGHVPPAAPGTPAPPRPGLRVTFVKTKPFVFSAQRPKVLAAGVVANFVRNSTFLRCVVCSTLMARAANAFIVVASLLLIKTGLLAGAGAKLFSKPPMI